MKKNLSGIGRGPLLGVSRPRLLGEVTCWEPSVSIPIKVFRADAGPMSHSKVCLSVGRLVIGAAPVLGTAAQFYPLRTMIKSTASEGILTHKLMDYLRRFLFHRMSPESLSPLNPPERMGRPYISMILPFFMELIKDSMLLNGLSEAIDST